MFQKKFKSKHEEEGEREREREREGEGELFSELNSLLYTWRTERLSHPTPTLCLWLSLLHLLQLITHE